MKFFLKQEQQFDEKIFPPYREDFYCLTTSEIGFLAQVGISNLGTEI